MTKAPRTHREVIRLLGGPTAVARDLGLQPVNTTVHWPTRGVPTKYRMRLAEKLATVGYTLCADDWDRLAVDTPAARAAA